MDNKERPPYPPHTHTRIHTRRATDRVVGSTAWEQQSHFSQASAYSRKLQGNQVLSRLSEEQIQCLPSWWPGFLAFSWQNHSVLLFLCTSEVNLLVGLSSVFSSCCLGFISSGRTEQKMHEWELKLFNCLFYCFFYLTNNTSLIDTLCLLGWIGLKLNTSVLDLLQSYCWVTTPLLYFVYPLNVHWINGLVHFS